MGGLGMIRLKYVHAFRDRAGRMRYYFRRHGIRTALPGLPGSNEFMVAYGAQLANAQTKVIPLAKAAPGTFAALAIRYFGSPQYLSLSATSRTNYRRVIDGFLQEHGHRLVKQMTREHVDIHHREDGQQTRSRDHSVEACPHVGALRVSAWLDRS
jgi:enterobacteria phage integrase